MKRFFEVVMSIVVAGCLVSPAAAQLNVTDPSVTFSYDQKMNVTLPSDLKFTDEAGKEVTLGSYFGKRPVVFAMVQYRCPMLCNQVLSGLTLCLAEMDGKPGKDYDVVIVSFDHREKAMPKLVTDKKASYADEYLRVYQEKLVKTRDAKPLTAEGEKDLRSTLDSSWHYLTGDIAEIDRLAMEVGFRFAYDPKGDRYAHPSGVVVLSPKGVTSFYFDGIQFASPTMQAAIDKSGRGEIGRPMRAWDRVFLLCYDYDAETGTLKANVLKIVRTAGVVTVVGLAAFLFFGGRLRRRWAVAPPSDSAAYFVPTPAKSAEGVSTSGEIRS